MRLLIVEDDLQIAQGLASALKVQGYVVDVVADGMAAENSLTETEYDLVLLDLGLPKLNGQTLLQNLRKSGKNIPVLVLTARDEINDRIKALDLGADDYMVKPFDLQEVEARVRAITRRALAGSGCELVLGKLKLSMAERRIYVGKDDVDLSPRELGILEILMLSRNRVVSKAQIHDRLCNAGEELSESAIELYIHRIRKKIDGSGVEVRTARGFGYLLSEMR